MPDLFDMNLRAMRRDRAARIGPELFLFERVFADCLERIALMNRRFEHSLLIGCPDAGWAGRMMPMAGAVTCRDPGSLFAAAAGGSVITEDDFEPTAQVYDLVLALGTLDTVNEVPRALRLIRHAMRSDALFIGACSGGDTLPRLRAAMREADALLGVAAPHAHPRLEAAALSPLLEDAGFVNPIVDVDRVQASYASLDRLVADLRAMGATSVLTAKAPPLGRSQREVANCAFAAAGEGGRTTEVFEILHFAAWTPPKG